jgi:uncharacterized membrane protein
MSRELPQYLPYALSSGACAALNGVFAKLTTTHLTTTYATYISRLLGQDEVNMYSELVVRGVRLSSPLNEHILLILSSCFLQ